jgi:hypothetical protein
MRQLTDQQKAARDERRAQFRAIVKQLADMPANEREEIFQKLGFVKLSTKERYSLINSLLIAAQMRGVTPTILGGYAEWHRQGRTVRKGERGFMIWIPTGVQKREIPAVDPKGQLTTMLEESTTVHFIIGTVFDISQTDALQPQKGA